MRRWLVMLLIGLVAIAAVARAQAPVIAGPPDRFVAPGTYATLVFRLQAPVDLDLDVVVEIDAGWTVLRPPGGFALEAGRSTPVAVTVQVPDDAPAGARARVTLRADGDGERVDHVVVLTVTERTAVELEVPRDVTLEPDGFEVVVVNAGNVFEAATVVLDRAGTVVATQTLELPPGARVPVRFRPSDDGLHGLRLTTGRGADVRRSVRVLRFGTGAPIPFALAAEATAAIGTSGRRALAFSVKGAVSDFVAIDARADGTSWGGSYADVAGGGWALRIGAGWRDPFGLRIGGDPGVAGTWEGERWGFGASAGYLEEDRFAGTLAVAWRDGSTRAAAGFGVRAAAPLLAVRFEAMPRADVRTVAEAGWRDRVVDASVQLDVRGEAISSRVGLAVRDAFGPEARLLFDARHRVAAAELYGDASVPLVAGASPAGRVGYREALITPLPGTLEAALQAGTSESFARVGYRSEIGGRWRAGATGGVRADSGGFGVTFDASLSRAGSDPAELDARLDYRPATGRWGGRVAAQATWTVAPVDLAVALTWNLGDRDLALGAVAAWTEGGWSMEVDGTVGVGYELPSAARWRADVALTSTYAFEIAVPEALTEAAGGRRIGTVEGRVATADGAALAGVVLTVGRYRAVSDPDGRYRLALPPGGYTATVDVATVPIAYRLEGPQSASIEVAVRATTIFDVRVVRTTALRGRVLEDREGDGRADEPVRPIVTRLRVVDADGLGRIVATDAAGGFEVRGLPEGAVRIDVLDLPQGASVVGDAPLVVALAAGDAVDVELLVRPLAVQVVEFGANRVRVRSVEVEVARAAPGTAPLVRVVVSGAAAAVALRVDGRTLDLAFDGTAWSGRLPVPASASAGVLPFVVAARAGDDTGERREQLVVDPDAPALEVSGDGPVRAGGRLTLEASAYFAAVSVTASGPYGTLDLAEVEPGRWRGVVEVPAEASDGIVELDVRAIATSGSTVATGFRFRVLGP